MGSGNENIDCGVFVNIFVKSVAIMAQSGSFYDDIKKEIECPVCQEQFSGSNEPKVLHCQHTFCKSCLESWLRQHHGGALTCPNCRQRTECPNNNIDCLPSNLTYKNLIDIFKTHSKNGDRGITFCERHKEKVKFYCEQCEICICSHCAILDHRNRNSHSIISLEDGAKKEKANIERKMRQLSAKSSRLNSYALFLEKRRALVNRSIEQATKEVHRVAQSCINSIRQHESSVIGLLKTQKSSCNDEYSKELSKLTEKIQRMKNVSSQSTNVLRQNNLHEMLNIKQVLDERIGEEVLPVLTYPEFKYISDDALYLNPAPGQLCITNTEPSLSVASGNGLTKGTRGKEGTFTVTTNDSKGHATYSEIDNVRVEMKSNQKGTEDIRSVVKDWKNGHYSISYTPNVAGKFSVSIKIREEPIKGSPFTLTVTKTTGILDGVPVPNLWTVEPKDSQGSLRDCYAKFEDIQWKYKIGNTFVEYERQLNAEIELAYHQKRKTMEIHQDGELYKISFVDMTEEDENGQRTEIKRIDSRKGLQTPDYWDPQPHDTKMYIVELKPSTHAHEYKKVRDLFSGTCSNRILKLERIQNPALYGLYAIQRQKMDEANGLGSNEKLLFHGTAGGNCNAINHKGFNRSYGWQKNNLYGKGVYFAAQADYFASSQFPPPDPTGRRHMYLARVLVGEYTVGKLNILEPPPKHPMDPTDTYDSVVDQIPNPEIFVVFQDPQCYPEYLITFQ